MTEKRISNIFRCVKLSFLSNTPQTHYNLSFHFYQCQLIQLLTLVPELWYFSADCPMLLLTTLQ